MIYIFFLFLSVLFAQEVPVEYFLEKKTQFGFDIGENWNLNSSLDPLRYFEFENNDMDSSLIRMNTNFGINIASESYYLFLHNRINFKKHFYLNAKFRVTNSPTDITGFTGISREKERLGSFNSGEYEYASIGYQDSWFLLQFGRGRQIWGAGNDIYLTLDKFSPSYDHLLIGLNLKNYKLRYFHGFLESIGHSIPINRYIVGRGIEHSNTKNLIISLNEIIIYHGENRPIDFSMLNPVGLHTEIEFNNRQNFQGNKQNAVWQISMDYFCLNRLRLSFNFLIDELTIDEEELKKDETNLTAFSSRLSYHTFSFKDFKINLSHSIEYVGTYTYKHIYGMNNFVSRGHLLMNQNGSDFIKNKITLECFDLLKTRMNFSYSDIIQGENNIFIDPYSSNENIYELPFPSGKKNKAQSISFLFDYWFNKTTNFNINYEYYLEEHSQKELRFTVFYFFPIKVKS